MDLVTFHFYSVFLIEQINVSNVGISADVTYEVNG